MDYTETPIKKEPSKNSYVDLITPDSPPATSSHYHHSPIEIPTERSDGKDTNFNSKYQRSTSSPTRYDKNRNKFDYNRDDRRHDRSDDRRYNRNERRPDRDDRDERRDDRRRERDYRYSDRDDRHHSESRRDRDDRRHEYQDEKRDRRGDDRHDRRSDFNIKKELIDTFEDWSNDSNTLAHAIKIESKKDKEKSLIFNPSAKSHHRHSSSSSTASSSNYHRHDKSKHHEKQSVFNRLGTKVQSTHPSFDLPPSPPQNSHLEEISPEEMSELLANNEDRFGSNKDDIKKKELEELYAMRNKIKNDLEQAKKSTYDPKRNEFLWEKSATSTPSVAKPAIAAIPSTSSASKNLPQATVAPNKPPVEPINPAFKPHGSIQKTSNEPMDRRPDKHHHKEFSFANEFKTLTKDSVTPFEIKSLQKPVKQQPPSPEKLKTPVISKELLDSLPAGDDTIYEVVKQAIATTIKNKHRPLSPTATLAVQKVIPSTSISSAPSISSPMSPPDPFINHAGHSENVRLAYKYKTKPKPRTSFDEPPPETTRNMAIVTPRCNNESSNRPISNGYNIPTVSNNDPRLRNRDPRVPSAVQVDLNQPIFPSAPGYQRDMFSPTTAPFNDPFGNTQFANSQMRSHFQGSGVHHPPNISPQYAQSPNSHVGVSPLAGLTSPPMNQFQPFSANVPKTNHAQAYSYPHNKDLDQNKNQFSVNNWYPSSDPSNKPPAAGDNCPRTYAEYRRNKQMKEKSAADTANSSSTNVMAKSQLDYVYSTNNYAATPASSKQTGDKFKIPKINKTPSTEPENKKKSTQQAKEMEYTANLDVQQNNVEEEEEEENWDDEEVQTINLDNSDNYSEDTDIDQETVVNNRRLRQRKRRAVKQAKKQTNKPAAVVVNKTPEVNPRDPRLNRNRSNPETSKANESSTKTNQNTTKPDKKTDKPVTEPVSVINQDDSIKTMLEGYLMNMFNPSNFGKENLLSMLGKVLDEGKFNQIKKIVNNDDEASKPDENEVNLNASSDKPDAAAHDLDAKNTEDEEDDEEHGVTCQPNPIINTQKVKKAKPKRKNELQKLNEDIRTMFISNGVLTATGRRMCTVIKENETPAAPVQRNVARKKTTVRPAPRPTTPAVEREETPEPEPEPERKGKL